MRFRNWTLDELIEYLKAMKSAPADRLDYHCVPRVRFNVEARSRDIRDDKVARLAERMDRA